MASLWGSTGASLRAAHTPLLTSRSYRPWSAVRGSIRSLSRQTPTKRLHLQNLTKTEDSLTAPKRLFVRSVSSTPQPEPSATLSQVPPTAFANNGDNSSGFNNTDGLPTLTTPAVAKWLYASAGLVFFIIVVGGVTRLTESGLSITEWEPVKGILPPIGDAQWQVEWEKYRVTPEGVLMNSDLDMPSFKKIFYMEWAHRIAGRALGIGFIIPAVYFVAKNKVSKSVRWKLLALAGGIGFQGFLGWYMVKSGLSEELLSTPGAVPRVSQYRLAMHLGAALLLYAGMVHTALGISKDWAFAKAQGKTAGVEVQSLMSVLNHPTVKRFSRWARVITAMVLFTAVSGAFVAGLDAGLIYNEFPLMGGSIVPPIEEMMDSRYAVKSDGSDKWWRNIFENPTTVQFDHRALAITTFLCVLSLPYLATRPALRRALPPKAIKWSKGAMHAGILQVTLGITTLLTLVPIPLAAAHQAGSVLLLTAMLGLLGSLKRPSAAARLWFEARSRMLTSQGQQSLSRDMMKNVKSGMERRINVP